MKRMRYNSSSALWLFLAGLGSMTEVHFFGSIAITELAMFAIAPILFFKNFHQLKSDGFMPFVALTLLASLGCCVSSIVNHTYRLFALKGLAVPVVYFMATVTFHHLLRKDLASAKWFLIGVFCSSIVSVFVFRQETHTLNAAVGEVMTGAEATEFVMGGALFWSGKINALMLLPVKCFYFVTPGIYCWLAPVVGSAISLLFSSGSGRAMAAVGVAGAAILFLGGKSQRRIAKLGKHIVVLGVAGMCLTVALKTTYSSLAKNGILGDAAKVKYEKQTSRGTGVLSILMSGRMEFFCGLTACIDKPIVGWGAKPEDTGNYVLNYLIKYATDEDVESYVNSVRADAVHGYRYRAIPQHSHIVACWLQFGIFGLLLWLYVFGLMYGYIRRYARAIPQWFGYLGLSIVGMTWAILFSPLGGRLNDMFFVVCLLFCKAVYNGKIRLPLAMEREVCKFR